MNCVFKTEMFTHMQRAMPGGFNLKIGETIEYAKKPNKMQQVKVLKDSQQRADFYKSGTIHTQQGQPPNSVSKPLPKAKPVAARPITRGKLIKPGGPGGRPSRLTGNRNTQPRPTPSGTRTVPPPPSALGSVVSVSSSASSNAGPSASTSTLSSVSHQVPVIGNANKPLSHARTPSASARAPPPPPAPPAPPAAKPKIMAKVLYDFAGQKENELSIKAGDILEIIQKENNGTYHSTCEILTPCSYDMI
jgi:myosin-1